MEFRALLKDRNITVRQEIQATHPAWLTLTEALKLRYENWEAARQRSWADPERRQPNGGVAEDLKGHQKLFRRETALKWLDEPLWLLEFEETA